MIDASADVVRRTRRRMLSVVAVCIVASATLVACGSSGGGAPTAPDRSTSEYSVGITSFTVVDATRPTPATAVQSGAPARTIRVRAWYPAVTASADQAVDDDFASVPDPAPQFEAPPATGSGPFPLIVFGHGLGATAAGYGDLLARWAAAGFIVVAPTFPLSSADAPGEPDAGDVANQPDDVRAVIDETIRRSSSASGGALAGMVDPDHVGVSGHSNGGITTVGVVASVCCRGVRLDAAIVFSGSEGLLPGGDIAWDRSVPLMVVHGEDDTILPIDEGMRIFDDASSPKWFVEMRDTDHGEYFLSSSKMFDRIARTTIGFWTTELAPDRPSIDGWASSTPGTFEISTVDGGGSVDPLVRPMPTAPDRRVSASPTTGLRDGDTVTVRWSGFVRGRVVNAMQCSPGGRGSVASCSVVTGRILVGDPTGTGSLSFEVHTGRIGDGRCDAGSSDCYLAINDASSRDDAANFRIPLSFAP